MSEGHIANEITRFVTHYLQEFQHVFKSIWDVEKEGVARDIKNWRKNCPHLKFMRFCSQLCAQKYGNHVTMDMMNLLSATIILMLH